MAEGSVFMGRKNIKKTKRVVWLIFFFVVLLLFLTTLGLQSYLYRIQQDERLTQVDNYSDYKITVREQNRREKKLRFQYGNDSYYYDGIDEIFISYGSTTAFLEEIIEKQFLEVEDILENTVYIPGEKENVSWYVHNSSYSEQRFLVQVITYEDYRDIIFQSYSESTLESLGYEPIQRK